MADAFIVTDVGLAAAVSAADQGIKLKLTSFKVGSGFGYTPEKTDTALHGTILYEDQITTYRVSSDGSLVVTCALSVDSGPFQFGEIGIYTESGDLFCLAALENTLQKYSSLGSNIASTYSFDAYLRLGQATTVIEVDSVTSVTYAQIIGALGYIPYDSANPDGYLVASEVVMPNSSPQFWSIGVGTAASGVQGTITATSDINTTGNITGFQTSDVRFKENMQAIDDALNIVNKLTGYYFDWSDAYIQNNGGISPWVPKHDVSLAAQEVAAAYPLAARQREDGTWTIQPTKFTPLLVEAIKQLDNKNRLLNNELNSLKERMSQLEARLSNS